MNHISWPFRRTSLFLALTFAVACSKAPQPASEQSSPKIAPPKVKEVTQEVPSPPVQSGLAKWDLVAEDLYYGIYLNGSKMGWMNSRLSSTETAIQASTQMEAKITGMGTVSTIVLVEERSYRISDGMLTSIEFSQSSATGSVAIKGKLVGDQLELSVTAGEVTSTKLVPAKETLADLQALQKLLRKPAVNATAKITRFDPSALQLLAVEHKVLAIERKVFGGVEVDTVHLESTYPQMGLSELSLYDNTGTLLETKVGGFFVARLEPVEVAKKLDYQQDLLISAVVKTPKPISGS